MGSIGALIAVGCAGPEPSSAADVGAAIDLVTAAPPPPADGVAAIVSSVVDGDTIRVDIDGQIETVRLLGIDTPEKAGGPRPAECFGAEASSFAEELLPVGTAVVLSRDRETRDQYGRLLAFVHRFDGLFVNLAMLEYGYASPLFFSPNTAMSDPFTAAADLARRMWTGFWPACGGPDVVVTAADTTQPPR